MSSYNRLTNGLRASLIKLPIWTTEADRRRALSYEDKSLDGAYEALDAVQAGRPAPSNLGLLIAIARYEDGGWMPDGCFERWRRWRDQRTEQLNVEELVLWLDSVESVMRRDHREREEALTNDCRRHDKQVTLDQDSANHAHERLHTHHKAWILARLSIGDTVGAQEIAQRMPVGPGRREIDQLLGKHATPTTPVLNVVREACIAELFAGTTPSDIVPLAERIAQRIAAQLILPDAAESAPPVPHPDDLTDKHLDNLLSGYSGVAGTDVLKRMVAEIRRSREALAVTTRVARVRHVVRLALEVVELGITQHQLNIVSERIASQLLIPVLSAAYVRQTVLHNASDVLEHPDTKVVRNYDIAGEIADRVVAELRIPAGALDHLGDPK